MLKQWTMLKAQKLPKGWLPFASHKQTYRCVLVNILTWCQPSEKAGKKRCSPVTISHHEAIPPIPTMEAAGSTLPKTKLALENRPSHKGYWGILVFKASIFSCYMLLSGRVTPPKNQKPTLDCSLIRQHKHFCSWYMFPILRGLLQRIVFTVFSNAGGVSLSNCTFVSL